VKLINNLMEFLYHRTVSRYAGLLRRTKSADRPRQVSDPSAKIMRRPAAATPQPEKLA
jgi:hypothetical protein